MSRLAVRALMAAVGLVVLLWHLALAALGVVVLSVVFRSTVDLAWTVALVVVVTLVLAVISYRAAPAQVLSSVDARPLSPEQAPWLFERLRRVAARMDVAVPEVRIARVGEPNAFALGGPGWGVVVLDATLVELLGPDELVAIVAHEMAHLESYDGLLKTLGFSVLRSVVGLALLALFPLTTLLRGMARALAWARGTPTRRHETLAGRIELFVEQSVGIGFLLLTLPLLALSRRREFAADARAAEVTGDPGALARALYRIERATSPPWGILSTLYVRGDEEGPLTRMLSTHPSTEERIERLRERTHPETGGRRQVPIR